MSRLSSRSPVTRGLIRARAVTGAPSAGRFLVPGAIVAAALLVGFVVLARLAAHPLLQPGGVLDDAVYVKLAQRVAAGDLALGPDVYYLAPLYTYFLGAVFALTHGSVMAARVAQVLLGGATVGLIMAIAGEWWGRRAALAAGVLAAATGLFAFNEILILQSSLDPFLAALALFAVGRAVRSERTAWFAAAGAGLGLLALNRPNALPLVAALAVAWIVVRRNAHAVRDAAVMALASALMVAPIAIRNRVVAGEWVALTSHGGLNFYIGNHAGADGVWQAIPGIRRSIEGQKDDVRTVAAAALGRPVSASEASSYFYRRAFEWIAGHPIAWSMLLLRKLALTFNAVDVGLNYSYTYFARDERSLLSVLAVEPWLLIPLGVFGLAFARTGPSRTDRAAYAVWAAFVPVYALTVAAFFVSSRYRLPLLVPLVAAAGAGAVWLWDRTQSLVRRESGARSVLVPLGVLALLAGVVNWPIEPDKGRMYQREDQIVRLITDGRIDEARQLIDRTQGMHPDPAAMFARIGLAFHEGGHLEESVTYLARAAELRPADGAVQMNLGEVLAELRRPQDALPHLQAARAAGLQPATLAYDLAGVYDALGRRDAARAALASIAVTPDLETPALLELGAAALRVEDAASAERFLRAAIARNARSAAAFERLGIALVLQNRTADAIRAFATAVQIAPDAAPAHVLLARSLAQAGRFADARLEAERATQIDPTDTDASGLLRQLRQIR